MDNPAYEAAWSRLEQIAGALGISTATFLAPPPKAVSAAEAAKQEEELLRLFRKVHDAGMRERLLDYMRAAADKAAA